MKKRMIIFVKGNGGKEYYFDFDGDDEYIAQWVADGLNVHVVVNSIPGWVARAGLAGPWCRLQDFWQLLRLF